MKIPTIFGNRLKSRLVDWKLTLDIFFHAFALFAITFYNLCLDLWGTFLYNVEAKQKRLHHQANIFRFLAIFEAIDRNITRWSTL